MNIIYIHGLDSDANSTKGLLLENYCQQYYADIKVFRPDLNHLPNQVINKLSTLVASLGGASRTTIVGSSLGGYFATLLSNHTGCATLLLNPSTQPHLSLQRFSANRAPIDITNKNADSEHVLHTTAGGWQITNTDLLWFSDHQLTNLTYPERMAVWVKEDDELLNTQKSAAFYKQQGATVVLQSGGDHRFSDFGEQLPMVIDTLKHLQQAEIEQHI